MAATEKLLFYLSFSTLMAHELDAMLQSEWRLLPILQLLPEPTAMAAFVLLHIPLVTALLWLTHSEVSSLRAKWRLGIAAFLAFHAVLHKLLDFLPDYTFHSLLSQGLIFGGGLLGCAYLAERYLAQQRSQQIN
ncbi:MAG TPA: DUF6713 family protein [Trichocoleus sp.]